MGILQAAPTELFYISVFNSTNRLLLTELSLCLNLNFYCHMVVCSSLAPLGIISVSRYLRLMLLKNLSIISSVRSGLFAYQSYTGRSYGAFHHIEFYFSYKQTAPAGATFLSAGSRLQREPHVYIVDFAIACIQRYYPNKLMDSGCKPDPAGS